MTRVAMAISPSLFYRPPYRHDHYISHCAIDARFRAICRAILHGHVFIADRAKSDAKKPRGMKADTPPANTPPRPLYFAAEMHYSNTHF